MTTGGVIFMVLSWSMVIGLAVFSFVNVFRAKSSAPTDSDELS